MSERDLLNVGNALWLFSIGLILAGFPQWAWLFTSWAGFALGYRWALKRKAAP